MTGADRFELKRIITARAPVFSTVLQELRTGRKRSHWMWFVFPLPRGLGHSAMANHYGIASLREARGYLAHPVLGPRLELGARTVLELKNEPLHEIFASPDDTKFLS